MKMYFKEDANMSVTLTSETGEDLWQFTSMADAIKTCREFYCFNGQVFSESNDPAYLQQA
jgi:hypothetical protein